MHRRIKEKKRDLLKMDFLCSRSPILLLPPHLSLTAFSRFGFALGDNHFELHLSRSIFVGGMGATFWVREVARMRCPSKWQEIITHLNLRMPKGTAQ